MTVSFFTSYFLYDVMKKYAVFEEKEDISENSEFTCFCKFLRSAIVKLRRWTYLQDIRKQTWRLYALVQSCENLVSYAQF
jgi:hypothetical protein